MTSFPTDIFEDFASRARAYVENTETAPVFPGSQAIAALAELDVPLQDESISASDTLALLDRIGSPATVRSTGGRYFGFVTGGALPAALSAKLLATVWDQNVGLWAQSPVATFLEEITAKWLISTLGLAPATGVGFVTGATMANFTALVSARDHLLRNEGWDAGAKGLFHAPEITVVVGDEVHVSLLKALSLAGLGTERIIRAPADDQGRIIIEKIPAATGPTIICAQAGNVNTGAFDDVHSISEKFRNESTWIHVDAAFGLWAATSSKFKGLVAGIEKADSLATDAHKWLNVPYDCGLVFVQNKHALTRAMSSAASYLPATGVREPFQYVPEMSREARAIAVWAALRSLGKNGLSRLVEKNCSQARRLAEKLGQAGYKILNDVVLNQVLVSFGTADDTLRVISGIQGDGVCWCGGTVWQGHTAMRISVSCWNTSDEDVEHSVEAIVRVARRECGKGHPKEV